MLQSPSAPLPRGHSKLSAALMSRSFWARLPPRAAALAALLYPLMERANTVTCTMQRAYKHTHTPLHARAYANAHPTLRRVRLRRLLRCRL